MTTHTIAHTYDEAQHRPAPDTSDVDALLAGTKLQRPYPLTGELVTGTIQFVYLSPYYRETIAGIARAYWTADDGSCTEYILLSEVL